MIGFSGTLGGRTLDVFFFGGGAFCERRALCPHACQALWSLGLSMPSEKIFSPNNFTVGGLLRR